MLTKTWDMSTGGEESFKFFTEMMFFLLMAPVGAEC